MKINMQKELYSDSLYGHLVLEALTHTLKQTEEFKKFVAKHGHVLEVKLLVEGQEMDIEKIVDLWEGQVDRMIAEKAKSITDKKIHKLIEVLQKYVDKEIL